MSIDNFYPRINTIATKLTELDQLLSELVSDSQDEIERHPDCVGQVTPEMAAPELDQARTHIDEALTLVKSQQGSV